MYGNIPFYHSQNSLFERKANLRPSDDAKVKGTRKYERPI